MKNLELFNYCINYIYRSIIVYMKTSRICKKVMCLLLSLTIILYIPSIFCGCIGNNRYDGELLRLHIRANSDDAVDQKVKLKVRDSVNAYIKANVDKTTFDEAYADIGARLSDIEAVANATLIAEGFAYGVHARLANEYFPTREYGEYVVPEGYYDALIIELGAGAGANWWCVIYPPLCYGENFAYRSFFAELFNK